MVGGTLWFVAFVAIWPVGGGSRVYSATGNLKASAKPSTCPTSARDVEHVGFSFFGSYIDKNHKGVRLNNQGQQHANWCEIYVRKNSKGVAMNVTEKVMLPISSTTISSICPVNL